MKKNFYFLSFFCAIFFKSFCVLSEENPKIKVEDAKGESYYEISLSTNDGLRLEGIVYRKLGGRWVVQIKSNSGLRMYMKNVEIKAISLSDYQIVLSSLLNFLSSSFEDKSIDRLHSDLRLVDQTWIDILKAIKGNVGSRKGKVQAKDKLLTSLIVEVLESSSQVSITCDELKRIYKKNCSASGVGMNPVAFRSDVYDKIWVDLLELEDAGVRDGSWFGIDFY